MLWIGNFVDPARVMKNGEQRYYFYFRSGLFRQTQAVLKNSGPVRNAVIAAKWQGVIFEDGVEDELEVHAAILPSAIAYTIFPVASLNIHFLSVKSRQNRGLGRCPQNRNGATPNQPRGSRSACLGLEAVHPLGVELRIGGDLSLHIQWAFGLGRRCNHEVREEHGEIREPLAVFFLRPGRRTNRRTPLFVHLCDIGDDSKCTGLRLRPNWPLFSAFRGKNAWRMPR